MPYGSHPRSDAQSRRLVSPDRRTILPAPGTHLGCEERCLLSRLYRAKGQAYRRAGAGRLGRGDTMIHVRAHPTLVLLAGLPATGRSTLAIALARRLGWPAIDKDLLTV